MRKTMVVAVALLSGSALAQSVRVGDQVEASPLMMDSRWESCTVTGLLPGGDVAVACGPRKTEYVVQGKWVRAGKAAPAAARAAAKAPASQGGQSKAAASLCPDAPRGMVGHRPQENGICRIGARVTDREGRTGTVIDAPDRTGCRVCLSDGSNRYYLTWTLTAAGARPAAQAGAAGAKASGNYQCYGGAAGNMRITITGGRWQGYYAETLPDGRVGISSQPNGRPYYMVCERR